MSIDLSKLEKPRIKSGKTIARCPACAETGDDKTGNHLFINTGDSKFGCVLYPSTSGEDHRKRIFELVGIPEEKTKPRKYTALSHAPSNAPDPSLRHYKHGLPVSHWTYHTPEGERAGIIARFNLTGGKKETLPITYCRDQNGDCSWQWKAMPDPRPLYGQPFDDRPIIICEGEKTAEAIRTAGFQATTWPGGCAAVQKADFRPLTGRLVTIWPDNDQPGFRAMSSVIAICLKLKCKVSVVVIPVEKPDGWDAADSPNEIEAIIASAEPHTQQDQPVDVFNDEHAPNGSRNRIEGLPFRILGMDDGIMRYMPDNGQHIVSLTPGSHTKLNLIQLAPLNSWEDVFPNKNGTDWDAAANALIQLSQSLPRFDPRSVRGRGCWIDGEAVVYHAGDTLSVAGKSHHIPDFQSEYIYEAGLRINIDEAKAATNAEAAKLIHLCESLSWEQPLYGKLLAGWMALAPICGAMQWRPHIWVTGSAGSGKTWIMGNIISPLLGRSAIFVQGNTTEAGIRGQIGCDALPVMFDEAEAENNRAASRMEGVMELARQASSESGAGIIKGTQNGGSITYMVRSMFCFSSIGVAAVKKADTSRISVLSLHKADDENQFATVKSIWKETTAKAEFCAAIRARSIKNAITTRENAQVFSSAAVEFTGDKRSADQIGTLLAGAYSLTSSKIISHDAAREWMIKQDWSGFKVDTLDSDENQCLSHLMSALIRVERDQSAPETISVDEAINRIRTRQSAEPELLTLLRSGIKVGTEEISIANSHQGLERIYRETPWSGAKWKNQLLRIDGATCPTSAVRFGTNIRQRSVNIPV